MFCAIDGVTVPERDPREAFIASSIQCSLTGLSTHQIEQAIDYCAARNVGIKWFGRRRPEGFTATFEHWRYVQPPKLDRTRAMLDGLCDMRIPLSLTEEDCRLIADVPHPSRCCRPQGAIEGADDMIRAAQAARRRCAGSRPVSRPPFCTR